MEPARPLRDAFADLIGDDDARRAHAADPGGFLEAHGYAGLPDDLLAEALVSYAGTAPVEVAEHLAPFVMAHGPVPVDLADGHRLDATSGLDLLATAPATWTSDDVEIDELDSAAPEAVPADPFDLDFGHGSADAEPGQDPVGHEAVEHDLAQPELQPDPAGHDMAGHDMAGHDTAGHDMAGHDTAGHEADGFDADEHDLGDYHRDDALDDDPDNLDGDDPGIDLASY